MIRFIIAAIFIVAGIFYYVFNLVVAVFFEYLEKRLSYYR